VEEASDQRGLAVVDAAAGEEAEELLALVAVEVGLDVFSGRGGSHGHRFAVSSESNYNVVMKAKTPLKRASKRPRRTGGKSATGVLTAKLVRVGNSRGVRLPKAVIEQAGLVDDVEIVVRGDEVILRRAGHPRAGWAAAFRKALAALPPEALEREREEWADWQNMPNDFDEKEWTW
jgi:antitoxin MazE